MIPMPFLKFSSAIIVSFLFYSCRNLTVCIRLPTFLTLDLAEGFVSKKMQVDCRLSSNTSKYKLSSMLVLLKLTNNCIIAFIRKTFMKILTAGI